MVNTAQIGITMLRLYQPKPGLCKHECPDRQIRPSRMAPLARRHAARRTRNRPGGPRAGACASCGRGRTTTASRMNGFVPSAADKFVQPTVLMAYFVFGRPQAVRTRPPRPSGRHALAAPNSGAGFG